MSGGRKLVSGALVVLVLPVAIVLAFSPGDESSATPPDVNHQTELNAAAIPNPAWVPWVIKSGHMCAAVTPPQIAAQIETESDWRPTLDGPPTRSGRAQGMAQFMPGEWGQWGRDEDGNGVSSPYDPPDAIVAMGRYDCALAKDVANEPGDKMANMLAAYNAGPNRVHKYHGPPPFKETQNYIKRIKERIPKYVAVAGPPGGGPATGFAQAEINAAKRYLGTKYVWGGGDTSGPTMGGFDCSGLVIYAVYQASGGKISLPHQAKVQATMGQPVSRDQMRPGDVIAFALHGDEIDHIGIYVGNNQMIHAPQTGDVVRIAPLNVSYYQRVPWTIRRFG